MGDRSLWRIEGAGGPGDGLGESLRLHLRYAGVTSALARSGGRWQAYVAGRGCEGCGAARCSASCPMALLRRALLASGAASDLRPVRRGLARRALARLAVAAPGGGARPLGAEILAGAPEARLWVTWSWRGGRPRASAARAVGPDGPDPAGLLAGAGWRSAAVPMALARALLWPAVPAALPAALPFAGEPFVLLPPRPAPASAAVSWEPGPGEAGGEPDVAGAAERLRALAAGCSPEPCAPPGSPSPAGGAPAVGLGRCAEILGRAIAEARRDDLPPAQRGLTVSRLRGCGATRPEARALMLWLDAAGAIAPPRDQRAPWREPRALTAGDLAELLALLAAAPAPDERAAAAAFDRQGG